MSSMGDDVRNIMRDVADSIRREPDLLTRVALVDEFIRVSMRESTDLRDATCYDLMASRYHRYTVPGLPAWVRRRYLYARRWAIRKGLPQRGSHGQGRPRNEGPDDYVEVHIPE